MAEKHGNTPLSIIGRLAAGLLTIAVFGGLFLDVLAAQNPQWHAKAQQVGIEATYKYLAVLKAFEGVE